MNIDIHKLSGLIEIIKKERGDKISDNRLTPAKMIRNYSQHITNQVKFLKNYL